MRSGNFYPRQVNTKGNVKKGRLARAFFFMGLILLGMANTASAQGPTVSHFSQVVAQEFVTVCNNTTVDLANYLEVDGYAPLATQLSYSVSITPTNGGTLSSQYQLVNTTGSTTKPPVNQFLYTPNPSYSGEENFIFDVFDGTNTLKVYFSVTVHQVPSISIPSPNAAPVCAGTTSTTFSYSNPQGVGYTSVIYNYTGGVQTFTVSTGVNTVHVDVIGGGGGSDDHSNAANPGKGARVEGDITVTPGTVMNIRVGGKGQNGSILGAQGGYNGGGDAFYYFYGCGGAGGGASDIRIGGNALGDRIVVAGGGAGNGWDNSGALFGGDGGYPSGGNGSNNAVGNHADGGTQFIGGNGSIYGGWLPGQNGMAGDGGDGSTQGISGGGGGGFYGGGGGIWNGGAGGSSFAGIAATHTSGYNAGDGQVVLQYQVPGSRYTIDWDLAAENAGFRDTTVINFPASPIVAAIPANPPLSNFPVIYHGKLTVSNASCDGDPIDITITINPIPGILPTPNQVVCNNDTAADIVFNSGGVAATTFSWTNTNDNVGIPAAGTDAQIAGFPRTNFTDAPIQGVITVVPSANGCPGAASTFTVVVNPTPRLQSTTLPMPVCDNTPFTYVQNSPTAGGVTFAWSRALVTGIANAAAFGTGDISETLVNTTPNQVSVIYVDTIRANGCQSIVNINQRVDPTPVLSTILTPSPICDSTLFSYAPNSLTSPTVFAWGRELTAGIANPAATGTGDPMEWLDNNTNVPVGVVYTYTLTAANCMSIAQVVDTVYPSSNLTSGSVVGSGFVCDSELVSYNPTSNVAGATFTWTRDSVNGLQNAAATGTDNPNEYLVNTTAHAVVATYHYTIFANNCFKTKDVTVTVNPRPRLIGGLSQPAICDSTQFSYLPTSFTVGTVFGWHRDTVLGIANSPATGTGNPMEVLDNTTPDPVSVNYAYTLTANGCINTQTVNVVVNPKPTLTSPLNPSAICDSATFSYVPASATAGSAFKWYRAYVAGIYQVAATGTGNPSEELVNTTNVGVSTSYTYTITANGCSNTQKVTVLVNPTPKLTSTPTGSVCSGEHFSYVPASFTPGATYTWQRATVANIAPATASGTGNIEDSMVNSTLLPINVIYRYKLGVNGCVNNFTQNVTVTVKAKAPIPQIIIGPGNSVCSGAMYQNFGASSPVPVDYSWSVTGATLWATGNTGQYALVSFPDAGTAVIKLNSSLPEVGCITSNTYQVNVSQSVAGNPQVIYFDGQFICLETNVESYQWGYDNAATLDSVMFTGETNQNYTDHNPDFSGKKYWVMTKKGDCLQKTYYQVPTGVTDVNGIASLSVYPNPTSDVINVDINVKISGDLQVDVVNMLGQKVASAIAQNNKAKFSMANLPAGAYIVDCYHEGIKIGAVRFIKN